MRENTTSTYKKEFTLADFDKMVKELHLDRPPPLVYANDALWDEIDKRTEELAKDYIKNIGK